MCSVLSATPTWLDSHQYLALWLEGIALLAIFIWDRIEASQQHKQTLTQMEITRNQARATETAANAATKSAEALINSERAWLIAELAPICRKFADQWYRPAGATWAPLSMEEILKGDYLEHKLKLTNMGRTPAHILGYQICYSCLGEGVKRLSEGSIRKQVSVRTFDHLLGAGDAVEIPESIDAKKYMGDRFTKITDLENTAVFHGCVRYQHVFSKTEVVEEPFCYVYRPSFRSLEKVPQMDSNEQNEGASSN